MANYNKILKSTATYGTNKNYVESKTSSTSSPLTTKGDVYTFSTSGTRLPVGTNGYVLSADSSEATGLKWVAASSANYYLTALTFGTDSKLTGSMQDTTNVTGNAMTTFTPVTTFVTGTKMGGNSSAAGYIQFLEDSSNGSHYTQIAGAASQAGNTTYTLPSAYPASNDYVLVSTTAGVMSWAENSASNYYTSSVAMGTDGILTGTIAGGGSNWTSTAFNVITDGQIAYGQSTSGLTTGSANLTYDGTNLSLAANTDVTATIGNAVIGYNFSDYASFSHYDMRADTNGYALMQKDDGTTYVNAPTGQEIRMRIENADIAAVTATGLGIGTTAPAYALDVSGAVDVRLGSGLGTDVMIAGTNHGITRQSNSIKLYNNAKNAYFGVRDSATGFVQISGSNVGIGTTSPGAALDVQDDTAGTALVSRIYHSEGSDAASSAELRIVGGNASTASLKFGDGAAYRYSLVTDTSDNLLFKATDTDTRMTLTSAGKLGIGTTSPSYPLHVVQASGDTYGMYLFNSASRGIYFGDTSNDGSGYGKIGGVGGSLFLGSTQVYTSFIPTGDSNATLGQQNRRWSYFFTRFGQVGYDTSTTTTAQFGISGAADKVPLEVYANGATTPALHVTSGSRVGIGTTAPARSLEVKGNGAYMAFNSTATDNHQFTIGSDNSGFIVYDDTLSTYRFVIDQDTGNVGIGTTAPSYPLHVNTTSTSYAARFENDSSNGYVMQLAASDSTLNFQTDHIIPSMNMHLGNDNVNFYMRTAGYKFGVGTSSPKTSMSLVGALSIEERADHETTNAGWGQLWVKNDTPNKLYYTDDAGTDFDLTLASTATGTIAGSLSDNYIPIGTAADTIGDFVLGLAENNSIWIGSDPTATTDTASKNVALGVTALDSITTGDSNVAIGYNAGTAVTTGGFSTYIGDMAGGLVTTTSYNNFIGYQAGYSATGQNQNNAMGYHALYQNDGTNNVAIGHNTMEGEAGADNDQTVAVGAYALRNISGSSNQNVAVGYAALQGASTGFTGYQNVALGNYAGINATSGFKNIIVGNEAGYDLTTAQENIIVGDQAGANIIGGSYNVVLGSDAYKTATTGNYNIAIGKNAIASGLVTSNLNVAIGYDSLKSLTSGDSAVAIGAYALDAMTTANNNTAVGHSAGSGLVDGASNTLVGKEAGLSLSDHSHNTLIGYNAAIYHTGGENVAVGSSALRTGSADYNVAVGMSAMTKVSGGAGGVAVGYQSGYHPTGNYNTWVGQKAGFGTAAGSAKQNVAVGREAMMNIDGGHSSVAVGYNTLKSLTGGDYNTYVGAYAGQSLTTGEYNVGMGRNAGYTLTTQDGNTHIGYEAGANCTAEYTVAIGSNALGLGVGEDYDVAIGYQAHYNGTGRGVFIGLQAGKATTGAGVHIGSEAGETSTSSGQVLIGQEAGKMVSGTATSMTAVGHGVSTNASGTYHTMLGYQAGGYLKGNVNTGFGFRALRSGTNATHQNNIAIGYQAMEGGNYSVTNQDNVAIGDNALRYASGSSYNVVVGQALFQADQTSTQCVAVGYRALSGATSTAATTAVGHLAARDLTTGDSHVAIGKSAMKSVTTTSYNTVIGVDALSEVDGAGSTTAVGFGAMKYSSADNATGIGQYALSGATGDKNAALGNSAGAVAKGSANSVMVGYQAGFHPTGNYNVWLGYKAGYGVVDSGAHNNVGVGNEAMLNVTSGGENVALGDQAGYSITTADYSVAIGSDALRSVTTGVGNIGIGRYAGSALGADQYTVAIGSSAAQDATTSASVLIGQNAGYNLTGDENVAIGKSALFTGTSATQIVAIGKGAGNNITTGLGVIAIGENAAQENEDGTHNVAIGWQAMMGASGKADRNVGIGTSTLLDITTGESNVGVGYQALQNITTGDFNVAMGNNAGRLLTTYASNVLLGHNAGYDLNQADNVFVGSLAGYSSESSGSTLLGFQAGYYPHGNHNTFVGYKAGKGDSSGVHTAHNNVAVGREALTAATSAEKNTILGTRAAAAITTQNASVFVGFEAGLGQQSGSGGNVALGHQALYSGTQNYQNTAIGINAGKKATGASSNNVYLGSAAGPSSTGAESNKLYIHNAEGTPLIGGDFSAGTVTINGTISATAKSFNIEHPLYKDKRLVHGSLEGPEHGIYIRGTIEASNGCEIELPEYWSAMCEDYTVQLTPHGPYTVFIREKQKDKVMIGCSDKNYKFDYYIVGARTDETLEVVQDG